MGLNPWKLMEFSMKSRRVLKIGTRRSALALTQTNMVLAMLSSLHPDRRFEIVEITTRGDTIRSARGLRRAGTGLFTKEIENGLLKRRIDLAVHSMKDVMTTLPEGLDIGAILERATAADLFIGKNGKGLDRQRPGAVVGTSSLRRQALLRAYYKGIEVAELRGNLDTRIRKVTEPGSRLDGIIVAAAGIERMPRYRDLTSYILPVETFIPAPAQGAICIEIRGDDGDLRSLLEPLHHEPTAIRVRAERFLLEAMGGGCQLPFGAHATIEGGGAMKLSAVLCSIEDGTLIAAEGMGAVDDPASLARAVETLLKDKGADGIIARIRELSA